MSFPTYPQIVTVSVVASFALIALYSFISCARIAKELTSRLAKQRQIEQKLNELENDFMDKYDEMVRKLTSRQKMRDKRGAKDEEPSEDSNTPQVILPV